MSNYVGGNIIRDNSIDSVIDEVPNSTFDLIIFHPNFKECPVRESLYSTWLFDLSKKMMRTLKSTGSLIVVMKESVSDGKRNSYSIDYLKKMSNSDYWTETYIWHKTNPHPTGNQKRLKDGFEYCYHFTRSKDYNFFPDQCLVEAKEEWNMGGESSRLTRPSNIVSFPSKGDDLPIGLVEFFINLMTESNDLVFIPFTNEGNEVIACLNTSREYFAACSGVKYEQFIEDRVCTWKGEHIYLNQSVFW